MKPQEKEDILFVQDKRYSHLFSTLPEHRRTYNVSWQAVETYPPNLAFVPFQHMDDAMLKMAAAKDGFAIENAFPSKLSDEIYSIAVNQNGGVLELVPEDKRTPELCMDAIKNNGFALEFVPEEFKTKELCRLAYMNANDLGGENHQVLAYIPHSDICFEGLKYFENSMATPFEIFGNINPKLMTEEMAMYAVKLDSVTINLVPDELKTTEMYLEAVKQDGMALYNIPEQHRTKEITETAIDSNYHSLRLLPEEQRTSELCMRALDNHPFAIQYFPADKLTHEACEKALKEAKHPRILLFIPFPDLHNKVLNEKCFDYSTSREFLEYMNPEYMEQSTANKIFEKQPELFYNIPDKFKTKELCETALKKDGYYLKLIPEDKKTVEMCKLAIENCPYAIPYILNEMKGEKHYLKMVKDNPVNLRGIPDEDKTYEMCKNALDNTFGKNINDLSVVSGVNEPSLLLEVFKAHDSAEKTDFLLDIVSKTMITPEIALEAMKKDSSILFKIPQESITAEVAELAVKSTPHVLQSVPVDLRTPDLILYTMKAIPQYNIYIPDEIQKGENIFSAHKRIEAIINKPLSYDEHKKLYQGESIRVNDVNTPKGMVKNGELRFDKQNGKLNIKSVTAHDKALNQDKQIDKSRKPPKKGNGMKF
ncbi:MAG TPA: hypothetical protein DIT04_14520 [Dysgonomonas sp.]|nr:hypothetical protein [Dysgonomonas sp.]